MGAVTEFQKSLGLSPDGVVGPETWAALYPYLTGFITHRVTKGDSLYQIAKKYGTSLALVKAANPDAVPENLTVGTDVTVPLSFPVVPDCVTFTPTALEISIEGLRARYPFITSEIVGRSVMGKPLYTLTVGTGDRSVFYNAAHHANEWITSPLLMTFLENLCRSVVTGERLGEYDVKNLLEKTTLHIMPMVNPDGVSLVTGELTQGKHFDKARVFSGDYPFVSFPDGWKANISGVDPNLQYPAGWETARDIKFAEGWVSPSPRDYVGRAALSIPESRAVYDYTLKNSFDLTISYHTQGGVIYWKYGEKAPEGAEILVRDFAAVSGYEAEDVPAASGYAGYKDWFIDKYGKPGFTIEAGRGDNPLPINQLPEIYRENEGILLRGLRP